MNRILFYAVTYKTKQQIFDVLNMPYKHKYSSFHNCNSQKDAQKLGRYLCSNPLENVKNGREHYDNILL
jgi:hypothetical protein